MAPRAKPAPWWAEAVLIRKTLSEAWQEHAKEYTDLVKKGLQLNSEGFSVDRNILARAEELLPEIASLMVSSTKKRTGVLLTLTEDRARRYFRKQQRKQGIKKVDEETSKRFLAKVGQNHVETFLKEHPERIVHAEVKRLADIMQTSEDLTSTDKLKLSKRLDRITKQDYYWDNLSSVETGRLWNAEGVLMAYESGVTRYQIVGPMDKKTCPVCQHLNGTIHEVKASRDRVLEWIHTSGIDTGQPLPPITKQKEDLWLHDHELCDMQAAS